MVLRPNDIHVMLHKFLVDFVEQPVTSGESTDNNDMLECGFTPNGVKGSKGD